MKKIYQIPAIEVEYMELEEMIAASVSLYGSDADSEGLDRDGDDLWD